MSQPWHDIDDPGVWHKPKAAESDAMSTRAQQQPPPEEKREAYVRLSKGEFLPPPEGVEFNKKCKVRVKVDFLNDLGKSMKKVTFSLFSIYKDETQSLSHTVDGYEENGDAEAGMTLYYPTGHKGDDKAQLFFKAFHLRGEKEIESERITLPREKVKIFPLPFRPDESYTESPRKFGANRNKGKRLHAGCDLYAPEGTKIYAIADGKVTLGPYEFYKGTQAIELDHGDSIVRYTEIQKAANGIAIGSSVIAGQLIAYSGKITFDDGTVMQMLHFELYSGKEKGPLTDKNNPPYMRRNDLLDPTDLLDKAILKKDA
jgi:murein DD-endopeptidase MepM/ murein hydrolase activator NlpD